MVTHNLASSHNLIIFSSVTSLTFTLLRIFSIVLLNTLLFISVKRSFSNEFLAFVVLFVLKSVYCCDHVTVFCLMFYTIKRTQVTRGNSLYIKAREPLLKDTEVSQYVASCGKQKFELVIIT